ncbi:hypothetical protein HS088_TW04G00577 [Tripterygium wilfordii]|uniref:Uncharacterized protein n=1 Tax=Tripterygium wilfordii TaxID=458696 RepID=A0A7J7DQR2_TRIWF|nr:hypothetical protein HS088_TW04G00577 [Tripterygium wilfordii]
MIYRKWSLLTGPVAILAGITVVATSANYLYLKNDLFPKAEQKMVDALPPASAR